MPPSGSPNSLSQTSSATPQRPTRRYKTQLRDFLSTCRSKRKLQQAQPPQHQSNSNMGQVCVFTIVYRTKMTKSNWSLSDNTASSSRGIHSRSSCRSCRIHESEPNVCNVTVSIIDRQPVYDTVGAFVKLLSSHWEFVSSVPVARRERILSERLSPFVGANIICSKWIFAIRWLYLNQRRKMARRRKVLPRSWCN